MDMIQNKKLPSAQPCETFRWEEKTKNGSPSDYPNLIEEVQAEEISEYFTEEKTVIPKIKPKIGKNFQVDINSVLKNSKIYEDEEENREGELLWDPMVLEESKVDDFLAKAQEKMEIKEFDEKNETLNTKTKNFDQKNKNVMTQEEILCLLNKNKYNLEKTLAEVQEKEICWSSKKTILSAWTKEEIENFGKAMKYNYKKFDLALKHELKNSNKQLGDLIHFYFLWKKLPKTEKETETSNSFDYDQEETIKPENLTDSTSKKRRRSEIYDSEEFETFNSIDSSGGEIIPRRIKRLRSSLDDPLSGSGEQFYSDLYDLSSGEESWGPYFVNNSPNSSQMIPNINTTNTLSSSLDSSLFYSLGLFPDLQQNTDFLTPEKELF